MKTRKEIKQLLNKIKRTKDFNKKTTLWADGNLDTCETPIALEEIVLSLPSGSYSFHGREYGSNLVDTVWEFYGNMPSWGMNESLMLGLAYHHPNKVHATFTHDMDSVTICDKNGKRP